MSQPSSLHNRIPQLLLPIVRFCLRRGVRVQELIEALKSACVIAAREELTEQGQEINVSRLSVLTGLQRKDIKRLESGTENVSGAANLLARVLGQWQADTRFCDQSGSPKALGAEGADSEFANLVRSVSADVNPYTILFGLEQAGAVLREGKQIKLSAFALDISKDEGQGVDLLQQDCNALYDSVAQNLKSAARTPNLHLTTEYDNICAENLPEIRDWLLDRGTAFHEEARAYLSRFDKDLNPRLHEKEGGAKVRLSAFSLVVPGRKV